MLKKTEDKYVASTYPTAGLFIINDTNNVKELVLVSKISGIVLSVVYDNFVLINDVYDELNNNNNNNTDGITIDKEMLLEIIGTISNADKIPTKKDK